MSDFPFSACIGLGSNLGDSLHTVQAAWQRLGEHKSINLRALSNPYRTQPEGMKSENRFINAAGVLSTTLTPEALLDRLLAVEHEFGRIRNPNLQEHQDRTLDLDLLLYDDCILKTSRLHLPHPEMHLRLFVLVPLAELVPDQYHPQLHCSIEILCRQCLRKHGNDGLESVRWPVQRNT